MNTREEIVEAALLLITSYISSPLSPAAASTPRQAGISSYNYLLGRELESYPYLFAVKVAGLSNPVILDHDGEDNQIKNYNIPASSRLIISIVQRDRVQQTLNQLAQGSKDSISSKNYTQIGEGLVQVVNVGDDDDLYVIYVDNDVDPSYMPVSFKNALRYLIAADLLPQYKDARSSRLIRQYLQLAHFDLRQAKNTDRINFNRVERYKNPTVDDVIRFGQPDGTVNERIDGV